MYILAVDDEKPALDNLETELKKVFVEKNIIKTTRPNEAIEYAKEIADRGENLSYAFLDIEMRAVSGIETAKRLKEIFPEVILVFCTAHSQYAIEAFGVYAKGYLLKPVDAKDIENVLDEMVKDWRNIPVNLPKDIRVQTFGHFEVFIDGVMLALEREKAKELFAYLVDRHGASVTTEQIAMVLWEDEAYDRKLKNRTTAVVASMKKTLKSVGIEHILVKTWNHLALDISQIKCDAYEYEKGNIAVMNFFKGEYMVNYSWAEFTTGKYVHMADK